MGLSLERCCEIVEEEIARLAAVTDGVDPATPVPTCGEWTVADLLDHTGTVFRWAATMVRDSAQQRYGREQMDFDRPDDKAAWPAWITEGAGFVVETFRSSDPSTPMWAWGWPKTAAFWPRRMVHEIGVHRADAELAVGIEPAFEPEVAADGVDELLDNLSHAAYFAPKVAELRGDGEVLAMDAPDAGAAWRIELVADGFTWERAEAAAPTTSLTAPAATLLLVLYGRDSTDRPDVAVDGGPGLLDHWLTNSSL